MSCTVVIFCIIYLYLWPLLWANTAFNLPVSSTEVCNNLPQTYMLAHTHKVNNGAIPTNKKKRSKRQTKTFPIQEFTIYIPTQ